MQHNCRQIAGHFQVARRPEWYLPQQATNTGGGARAEAEYWWNGDRDVEIFEQPDSGHAFQRHQSMPAFIARVVTWLGAKGLAAQPLGGTRYACYRW